MTNYDKLTDHVRALGMDYKWARMFVKKLRDDEAAFPVADEEQKKWALERGFYPGRIELYGLTEENYRDYVPDFQYFMLHPMNNHFLKWLDKTTLKYVLNSNGCESTMPEYYVYVENDGSFTYLMDCPEHLPKTADFLMELLRYKGILAMKPNSGTSGGLGFIKLELRGEELYENNRPIDEARFIQIRDSMRNYIITEYAHQHPELAKVWPDSECTLRIIMGKAPKQSLYEPAVWDCAVSFARFGTSISGGTSNLSAGGVGIGFDFETGRCRGRGVQYRRFSRDGGWYIDRHPDSLCSWEGMTMPNWPYVKQKIEDVCRHISSLDYIGLDVIITKDGMKLCEINSHPAVDYSQLLCGPVLAKERLRRFYASKGLYDQDPAAFYRAYMECQE